MAVRWTCPAATSPVIMPVTKPCRRVPVKGLATPRANDDNRRRIGVVSVAPAIGPASLLLGSQHQVAEAFPFHLSSPDHTG
jgi:hypothetical protein